MWIISCATDIMICECVVCVRLLSLMMWLPSSVTW